MALARRLATEGFGVNKSAGAVHVIVDDVQKSPVIERTPVLEVMVAAGARAVQSTPLVSRSGRVLGMFSTHYQHAPQQPATGPCDSSDIQARQAADLIENEQGAETLRAKEADLELVIDRADNQPATTCLDFLLNAMVDMAHTRGYCENVLAYQWRLPEGNER